MATSPNFNWPEPDNTDLVKNGALAIRTAVNAIDTSLVDLKGGTTGQVLSKASGTDMDFTWVAQDDSNAIQNAIVDAKGDLITATAADTPARLPVGTNGQVLKANSATATGLEWAADSAGMTNPMTTTGDTIYSSSGSTPARLGIGSTGQVLTVAGGIPSWATPSSGGSTWSRVANGTLSGASISVNVNAAEILISLNNFSQGSSSRPIVRVNNNSSAGTYGVQNNEQFGAIRMNGSSTTGGMAFCYIAAANTTAITKFGIANLYPSYINLSAAITSVQILAEDGAGSFSGGNYEVWTR